MTIYRHVPNGHRAKALCLWCGKTFTPVGDSSSYCSPTHGEKARQRRRDRRRWVWEGCDVPDAPAIADRGLAIAGLKGGELFVCKCGSYHVVPAGEGGRSIELGSSAGVTG